MMLLIVGVDLNWIRYYNTNKHKDSEPWSIYQWVSLSPSDEAEGGHVMWFHAAPLTLTLMICIRTTRQGINQKMKSISTYLIKFFVTL